MLFQRFASNFPLSCGLQRGRVSVADIVLFFLQFLLLELWLKVENDFGQTT